ncbi:BspA family leucine-rich repeat surface protein [Oceanivirga miroungae]|uniref:Extracellular matrix-binding protein ebh n=1 Tax=Oceanivirga miroungae TaxID=1130046 RepID=A0A6I8MBH9_9FUSO|nr:BspA family leucine-rich repeat surface protein [Oceanivirga miroungae]VWL85561.1 Extracellular matrix-binding protein ebh [Oceanivirga miroungae]
MNIRKLIIPMSFVSLISFADRVDIGTNPNSVFIEKTGNTIDVTGSGEINKEKFRNFMKRHLSKNETTLNLKSPDLRFPNDSSRFFYEYIGQIEIDREIDTSNVTNMESMFEHTINANPDVSNWNTSNVTNMKNLFNYARNSNPDVTNWDTSNVTDMSYLFYYAEEATPNVSNWNTSSVTTMKEMFTNAVKADPNVTNWDTSNVTDMSGMFWAARASNPNVSKWDTSNVTNMSKMFYGASIANPDVSNWDTSNVINMSGMFSTYNANPDVSKWDTSKVKTMDWMFYNNYVANPDVSKWDTSSVVDMDHMFSSTKKANPDVSNWNTSNVTNMAAMFSSTDVANPDISKWDTSKVRDISFMFNGSNSAYPDITELNFDSIKNSNSMFSNSAFEKEIQKTKPYISKDDLNASHMNELKALQKKLKNEAPEYTKVIIHYKEKDNKNRKVHVWDNNYHDNNENFSSSGTDDYGKIFEVVLKGNITKMGYIFANTDNWYDKDCLGDSSCNADRIIDTTKTKEIWVEQNNRDRDVTKETDAKQSKEENIQKINDLTNLNEKQKEYLLNLANNSSDSELKELVKTATYLDTEMSKFNNANETFSNKTSESTDDKIIRLKEYIKMQKIKNLKLNDVSDLINKIKSMDIRLLQNLNKKQKDALVNKANSSDNLDDLLNKAKKLDEEMLKLNNTIDAFLEEIKNIQNDKAEIFKNNINTDKESNLDIDKISDLINEINAFKSNILKIEEIKKLENLNDSQRNALISEADTSDDLDALLEKASTLDEQMKVLKDFLVNTENSTAADVSKLRTEINSVKETNLSIEKVNDLIKKINELNNSKNDTITKIQNLANLNALQKEKLIEVVNSSNDTFDIILEKATALDTKMGELRQKLKDLENISNEKITEFIASTTKEIEKITVENARTSITKLKNDITTFETKVLKIEEIKKLENLNDSQRNALISEADTSNDLDALLEKASTLDEQMKVLKDFLVNTENSTAADVSKLRTEINSVKETNLSIEKVNDLIKKINELNNSKNDTITKIQNLANLNALQKEKLIEVVNSSNDTFDIILEKATALDTKMGELRQKLKDLENISNEKITEFIASIEKITVENAKTSIDTLTQEITDFKTKVLKIQKIRKLENLNESQRNALISEADTSNDLDALLEKASTLDAQMKVLNDKLNDFLEKAENLGDENAKKIGNNIKAKIVKENLTIDDINNLKNEINKFKFENKKIDLTKYKKYADAFYYTDNSITNKFDENLYFDVNLSKSLVTVLDDLVNKKKVDINIISGVQLGANFKVKNDLDLKLGGFIEYQNGLSRNISIGTSITYKEFLSFLRYRRASKDKLVNDNIDIYARYSKSFKFNNINLQPKFGLYLTYSSKVKLDKNVLLNSRIGSIADFALLMSYDINRYSIYLEPKLAFSQNTQKIVQTNYKSNELLINRAYLNYSLRLGAKYRFINNITLDGSFNFSNDINKNSKIGANLGVSYKW